MQRSRIVLANLILLVAACGNKAATGYGPGAGGQGGGDDASLSDDDSGLGGAFSPGDAGGTFQGTGSLDAATSTYVAESGVAVTLVDTCTATAAPSGLSASAMTSLLAGGSPGSMRFLYPYASTVFPRGLISPTLMWDGASANYVYVHLKSNVFEYKGCLAPTATGQVLLPQNVWVAASANTSGPADPFTLSLTTISGSTVTGPISEPLIIAAATLAGSVYYNSYTTSLSSGSGGAVLRIVPGQNATLFLGQSGCTACHAVSANGSRMVADPYNPLNNGAGSSYALTPSIGPNPTALSTTVPNGTFVGMYPDGTMYLGNAHPNDGLGGPRAGSPGYAGPVNAGLFETDTGTAISNTNIPTTAMTPMFSPDGTLLAFNDYAIANGGGLATMAFSKANRTASGYKQVFQVTDTTTYPGWPFYLPDNGGLIFAIGNQSDFSGAGIGLGLAGGATNATSDLYILDIASGASTILGEAVGFTSAANASSSTTYLPYGTADLHHNFYPTVSPVAAGGYFWVFFDSYRNYGNNGVQRQLYGTAVEVSATGHYATDPSHPPFYVTGQELGTGNHRAFTALDACLGNGSGCVSGFDCCAGFCTDDICGMPTSPRCSNTGETCSSTQSCCITSNECIAGYCSTVTAQ